MTRLFDRIMAKGMQISVADMMEANRLFLPASNSDLLTYDDGPEWQLLAKRLRPAGTGLRRDVLRQARVVAAESVFQYVDELDVDADELGAMLSAIAVVPPYEHLVVEAQKLSGSFPAFAWLVMRGDRPGGGWFMDASLMVEWTKGKPIGPIVNLEFTLEPDGKYVHDDTGTGLPATMVSYPQVSDAPGVLEGLCEPVVIGHGYKAIATLVLTLGLMHCKNVDEVRQTPEPRASAANKRRHGEPLTRYTTLDIRPVTRALDRDGGARRDGLGTALHRCRGHFKTFRPDAPLFGKLTGQYWWNSHTRGKAGLGAVESSYRVHPPEPERIGRRYTVAERELASQEPGATAAPGKGRDPDLAGRGSRAHAHVQNLLAERAAAAGLVPLSPGPADPQFDLAWFAGDELMVVEVKSITDDNEVHQVRLAIGQVLEYVGVLQAAVGKVRPIIALERPLTKDSLLAACAQAAITVTWPDRFKELFSPISPSQLP